MITKVKCKTIHCHCKVCGAVYELNKSKDFRKVKWNTIASEPFGVMKCKCCKQRIFVDGVCA